MTDNNQEPQRIIDSVPGISSPEVVTAASRELGNVVVSNNVAQEPVTEHQINVRVENYTGDPSKVLGHPTNPMNGLGAALIKRSEDAAAKKAEDLANQPPALYSVTDNEGNLIPPPPEARSINPWSPREQV